MVRGVKNPPVKFFVKLFSFLLEKKTSEAASFWQRLSLFFVTKTATILNKSSTFVMSKFTITLATATVTLLTLAPWALRQQIQLIQFITLARWAFRQQIQFIT